MRHSVSRVSVVWTLGVVMIVVVGATLVRRQVEGVAIHGSALALALPEGGRCISVPPAQLEAGETQKSAQQPVYFISCGGLVE